MEKGTAGGIKSNISGIRNWGFDAGGGEILYYKGIPFTGDIVEYKDGALIEEEEFKDGHVNGAQRSYYHSGQLNMSILLYLIHTMVYTGNGMNRVI